MFLNKKTIADLEKKAKNPSLVLLGKRMLTGKDGIIDYTDYISNEVKKDSWAFLYQIAPTEWHFAAIYYKEEVFVKHIKKIKQNKI
ncbi:hypothetical protein KKA53_03340 [Candidatus Dependentiae bacterium]|nr:hypothetical protein [Candidatus Dependentiae bacterium]